MGALTYTLIILIVSDINIVPKYRINMLVTTQSQKLPAHPFLEEAIKQFQEKIKIKVSWQEPRKLASHSSAGRRETWRCFLKRILTKPLA